MGGVFMAEIIYEPVPDSKLLGMVRAIGGIKDAVAIVHGKSCCHADNLLFNILTGPQDDIRILGSGIRSQDISVGGKRKLTLAIRAAYEEFNPELIAVLITSFTTLMGDDVEGVIETLKEEIPSEMCSFQCAGYIGDTSSGIREFICFLTRYMERGSPSDGQVNLIGLMPDEPHARSDLKEIERMLKKIGLQVKCAIPGCSFKEIRCAADATFNIVFSDEGLDLATTMEETFEIPYVMVPYPFGWRGSMEFFQKVCDALKISFKEELLSEEREKVRRRLQEVYKYLQGIYGLPVAVVGKGMKAISLCRFLSEELGFDIELLCLNDNLSGEEGDILREIDVDELIISRDQFEIEDAIRSRKVHLVFGSTMEKKVCVDLGIPLVRVSYPVLDEISITDRPYAGIEGVLNLTEAIINCIISQGGQV